MKAMPGWEETIEEAQRLRAYLIQGRAMLRVPYGSEQLDWGASRGPCHDCGVVEGQLHVPGCDVEECPLCHYQSFACACDDPEEEWCEA